MDSISFMCQENIKSIQSSKENPVSQQPTLRDTTLDLMENVACEETSQIKKYINMNTETKEFNSKSCNENSDSIGEIAEKLGSEENTQNQEKQEHGQNSDVEEENCQPTKLPHALLLKPVHSVEPELNAVQVEPELNAVKVEPELNTVSQEKRDEIIDSKSEDNKLVPIGVSLDPKSKVTELFYIVTNKDEKNDLAVPYLAQDTFDQQCVEYGSTVQHRSIQEQVNNMIKHSSGITVDTKKPDLTRFIVEHCYSKSKALNGETNTKGNVRVKEYKELGTKGDKRISNDRKDYLQNKLGKTITCSSKGPQRKRNRCKISLNVGKTTTADEEYSVKLDVQSKSEMHTRQSKTSVDSNPKAVKPQNLCTTKQTCVLQNKTQNHEIQTMCISFRKKQSWWR